MYMPSAAPWSTTLVSPGDDGHAGRRSRFGHVGHDQRAVVYREALFEHERSR